MLNWSTSVLAATLLLLISGKDALNVANNCSTWYSAGYTDPGYYLIIKNGDNVTAYCPFADVENYTTCQDFIDAGFNMTGYYQIDPDGSAAGNPFEIFCDFDTVLNGAVLTTVEHDQQGQTHLQLKTSRYSGPGTYEVDIVYGGNASAAEVNVMARTQYKCTQYIRYKCKMTKIWDSKDDTHYTWWEASDGSQMDNWGAVDTGNTGCLCGQYGTCRGGSSLRCHCDEEYNGFLMDGGLLLDKSFLPINKLAVGDHGSGREEAYYEMGVLTCYGGDGVSFPVPTSCKDASDMGYTTTGYYVIDNDDFSGPLGLLLVYCDFDALENAVVTTVGHDTEDWRQVSGYARSGGWARDIHYDHVDTIGQLTALTDAATACRQLFNYRSFESARISLATNSWWSNRNYSKTSYLGDHSNSGKCTCYLYGQCYDSSQDCNSDAGENVMLEDGGWLTRKADLPVMQLFLGDTGGSKYVQYELGQLWCAEETSTVLSSCYAMKLNGDTGSGYFLVDPDGSGGNEPFAVYCDLDYNSTHAEMVLSHDTENKTHVTGHTTEGEYLKMITYDGMMYDQLLTLFDINQTEISMACRQSISYECYNSRLLEGNYAWWVSRTGEIKRFWGGTEQDGYCACGENNTCAVSGDTCNCASQQSAWLEDEGDLMDWFTEYLPVMQLRIGDTGTEGSSEGYFTLGKLYCYIGPDDTQLVDVGLHWKMRWQQEVTQYTQTYL
ncbi:hypothetical protein BSL78_10887 [Apostichopus japonicus]|uniref:Uncharacterized protein n=1 Tax=Stichopus japonicus TaxID=307972 RepID=A0A2G8KW82_STIJA|nr:hypothetical protein BSL78_10887 [Apostichopus japonicus]